MLKELLRSVDAVVSFSPPGLRVSFVRVSLKLDRLTVFVGPNASGKTTVLQVIGYILSGLLDPMNNSLGFALTRTLRPEGSIPKLVGGTAILNGNTIHNLLIAPHAFTSPTALASLGEIIDTLRFDPRIRTRLESEIENDLLKYINSMAKAEQEYDSKAARLIPSSRMRVYLLLREFVNNMLGKNVQIAISDPFFGVSPLEEEVLEDESFRFLRYLLRARRENIRVSYVVEDSGRIDKIILIGVAQASVVVFKRRNMSRFFENILSVKVFHPGFIFSTGVFEGLYGYYARRGLPREREALDLLRKYISWVEGYELFGHRLFLKSSDGRRISIYSLSDGHRVAVFMSLLYALSGGRVVFLIDTPEAFVHPDGLPLIADFITRLVKEGNQVIVATQSIEFLRRLLLSSREHGVISDTLVERIDLSPNGVIRPIGMWSGEVSLNSIDKLGLDLRR